MRRTSSPCPFLCPLSSSHLILSYVHTIGQDWTEDWTVWKCRTAVIQIRTQLPSGCTVEDKDTCRLETQDQLLSVNTTPLQHHINNPATQANTSKHFVRPASQQTKYPRPPPPPLVLQPVPTLDHLKLFQLTGLYSPALSHKATHQSPAGRLGSTVQKVTGS